MTCFSLIPIHKRELYGASTTIMGSILRQPPPSKLLAGGQEKAGAVCGPVPLNIYNFDDITDSYRAGGIISLLDATKAYKTRKHLEILILFPKIQKCFDVT